MSEPDHRRSEYKGDLAEALSIIMEYMRGKGQLPRLDKFLVFYIGIQHLARLYCLHEKEILDLDALVEKYSINAPPIETPLWLKAINEIAKINHKTEIITQVAKRKPLE